MIEINLIHKKQAQKLPVVLGIDLTQINIKFILILLVLSFIPDFFLKNNWKKEVEGLKAKSEVLNKTIANLEKEGRAYQEVQKQIDVLNEQEKKLNSKLDVVKKIIGIKQNPFQIMQYIAKNMPEDLWLTSMVLKDKELILEGFSESYRSIGLFIESLKTSVFFDQNLRLAQTQVAEDPVSGKTRESFTIQAMVTRFE